VPEFGIRHPGLAIPRPALGPGETLNWTASDPGGVVDRTAVREASDALGDAYAAERTADGAELARLDRILDSLPDGARLLDAGCGPGVPILRRAGASTAAVGLDASREQLRLARDAAPGAALVRGDLTRLPLREDAVDVVVCLHALIHVPLAAHRTVLDEFARVLGPGGRLLVTEAPDEWRGSTPDWLGSGVRMAWEIAGADATRQALRDAGFRVEAEWGGADGDDCVGEDGEGGTGGEDGEGDCDDEQWIYFAARPDA